MEEIKVMQFERSDVLRQRRLKNQLAVKEFRDELLFRRIMTGGVIVTLTMLGFLAGEITASIFTIRKSTHMSRQAPRCPNKNQQLKL